MTELSDLGVGAYLANPRSHEPAVRNEAVHPGGRAQVPQPEVVKHYPRKRSPDFPCDSAGVEILPLKVPGVARRCVHVTQMELVAAGKHDIRYRLGPGNDEILSRKIVLAGAAHYVSSSDPKAITLSAPPSEWVEGEHGNLFTEAGAGT